MSPSIQLSSVITKQLDSFYGPWICSTFPTLSTNMQELHIIQIEDCTRGVETLSINSRSVHNGTCMHDVCDRLFAVIRIKVTCSQCKKAHCQAISGTYNGRKCESRLSMTQNDSKICAKVTCKIIYLKQVHRLLAPDDSSEVTRNQFASSRDTPQEWEGKPHKFHQK